MRNRHLFFSSLILLLLLTACTPTRYSPEDYPEVDRQTTLPEDIVKGTPANDRHPPLLHSDDYQQPVPVPGDVNTIGGEDSPFILPDGQTLYFFFTPDVRLPHDQQIRDGVTGMYAARLENGTWGSVARVWLAPPGTLAMDGAFSVQGDELWFASVREGYTGPMMFTAEWMGARWGNWEPVSDRLMYEIQIGEVHIHGDELYFHSDRADGKGDRDIWKTTRDGQGNWSDPINIEAVNTEGMEG
jgi:hypothetical protein